MSTPGATTPTVAVTRRAARAIRLALAVGHGAEGVASLLGMPAYVVRAVAAGRYIAAANGRDCAPSDVPSEERWPREGAAGEQHQPARPYESDQ